MIYTLCPLFFVCKSKYNNLLGAWAGNARPPESKMGFDFFNLGILGKLSNSVSRKIYILKRKKNRKETYIMAYSSYQNSDNIVPYYQALVADTEDDINTLPKQCAPGSTCLVVSNSSLWVLGNDEKWHKLTK